MLIIKKQIKLIYTTGMLADIYGRKKILIAGQILGTVDCIIMAISNGFLVLHFLLCS